MRLIKRAALLIILITSFAMFQKLASKLNMHTGSPQSSSSAPGALGANYNEKLTWIDHNELQRVNAQWIRGFIDMHLINTANPAQDPNIQSLFKAIDAGYKTILSFKWNYAQQAFPEPGTPEHNTELQRLESVLGVVTDKVNILVIGNEPFIEALPGHTDHRLNDFYEAMANKVITFISTTTSSKPNPKLFMGAFNRLDLPEKRTPAITRMLRFIASKPELAGVDIHPHMPTLEGHRSMLSYVLSFLRPDQRFLVTEFSLVWYWKQHLGDTISPDSTQTYNVAPQTKVHQVLSSAMQNPWSYEQWEDFLAHEDWYVRRRGFLGNAMAMYRDTGRLEVATYAFCPMRLRKAPIPVDGNPWMLNGVFAPSTVRLRDDGSRYENFPWGEEFRKVQNR